MFCSTCGKTIHATDDTCPHCGAAIGESRFGGTPYTSAQAVIPPNQTSFEQMRNYTRTTYTSKGEEAEDSAAVDSRTTYRPVFEDDQSPRDLGLDPRDMGLERKGGPKVGEDVEDDDSVANFIPGVPLSREAQETLDELERELTPEEQIDRAQFVTKPIVSAGRAGISQDVSDYIRQLEDEQSRKANSRRRRRHADYDDYAQPQEGVEGKGAPQEGEEGYAPEEGYAEGEPGNEEGYEEGYEDGYEDGEYYGEDGYYDDRRFPFSLSQVLRVVAALAVVALLVFGITRVAGNVVKRQSSSPIEGVSEELYEQGLELIRSHTDQSYIDGLVSSYASDGVIAVNNQLEAGRKAINALMPAEPASYDQTFVNALLKIEDNIGNAVLMDGLNATNPNAGADAEANSQANWQVVTNSVAQLEAAASYSDLNTIIGGATVTVQSQTPEPTATAETYSTLAKGDENNEVMQMQVRLYNLGYLNGDRDGVYGSKTATAVGLFQERAGLPVNGNVADNATQVALYADNAPYASGHETPEPTAAPTPEPTEEMIQPAEANGANVV